jgi:hypothetical protein
MQAMVRKTILELRALHTAMTNALARCEREAHKDMVQVSPGFWIHKSFRSASDAIAWASSFLPNICPAVVHVGSHTPGHGQVTADGGLPGGLIRILAPRPAFLSARMAVHVEDGKRKSGHSLAGNMQ